MQAQLQRPSHDHEDGGTHSVVEGGGEGEQQHHEKKSVLKKVKDKAKKIKDTIKKHGHGHHHHDDDDEEDHEIHGVHESTVVRSINLTRESNTNPRSPNNSPPTEEGQRSDHQLNSGSNNPVSEQGNSKGDTIAGKISSKLGYGSENGGKDSNKGQSVKEYLCEKLKPGEEDKALSEAITDALHKKEQPKRGKVTVSKEVAERLGSAQENKREGEDALAAGEETSGQGQGVAERLQNAVSLWLGKSNGIETARDSVANAYVSDAASGGGPMSNEPHHR